MEILLRRIKGDTVQDSDRLDILQGKVIVHNLPTIHSYDVTGTPLKEAPGASQFCGVDEDRFLNVSGFASTERPDITVYHHVTKRALMTFLVVYRKAGSKGIKSWSFPPLSICQDFINGLLNDMYTQDIQHVGAYARSGKWGKVQTLILSTSDVDAMLDFRRSVSTMTFQGFQFDTFPKDAATVKADINILLKDSMKAFKTELIPKVLFSRNPEILAGSLRVLSTRFFGEGEKSHKGESKEHWRVVELQGSEQLMRCLRSIPESRPFLLGYDTAQIRGGLRPEEPNLAGHKRNWSDTPISRTPLLIDPRIQQNDRRPPGGDSVSDAPLHEQESHGGNNQRGGTSRGKPSRGARGGRRGRWSRKF